MTETLSFPYPVMGSIRRPVGQGCGSCVHREYCQAFYWLYRYAQHPSKNNKAGEVLDEHLGIQCASWSNNPNDRITTVTQDDLDYNYRLGVTDAILTEPFRNGITDPVTGSDRQQTS